MLIKSCVLASQVELNCFEIDEIIFTPRSSIALAKARGWISEEARDSGAAPAWTGTFDWEVGDSPELASAALALAESKLSACIDAGGVQ